MNTALLIIDIQNDYFPGGAMELVGAEAAAERAASVLAAWRAGNLPIVHVQHLSVRPGATFFRPDTPGAEIHPLVAPLAGETVIRKHYPNAFRETKLPEHLRSRGIEQLVVVGMMTHMCIDTTTRAAADLGFQCTLVHDACATRDLKFGDSVVKAADVQAAFMAALHGLFAQVADAGSVVAQAELPARTL